MGQRTRTSVDLKRVVQNVHQGFTQAFRIVSHCGIFRNSFCIKEGHHTARKKDTSAALCRSTQFAVLSLLHVSKHVHKVSSGLVCHVLPRRRVDCSLQKNFAHFMFTLLHSTSFDSFVDSSRIGKLARQCLHLRSRSFLQMFTRAVRATQDALTLILNLYRFVFCRRQFSRLHVSCSCFFGCVFPFLVALVCVILP